MLIHEVSQLTGRSSGLLATVLKLAPIFQAAQFRLNPSYFATIPDKSTFAGSAARAEGSPIQRDAQKPTPTGVNLALYGRELSIDDLRLEDVRVTGSPQLLLNFADNQLLSLAIQIFQEVEIDMFQGLGTSNQMLGLFQLVKDALAAGQTAALGFTTAELAAMNSNVSLKLDNIDDQDAFVELLIKKLVEVPGANALVMNQNMYARMTTIGKRKGLLAESPNTFGVPNDTFNRVPMIAVPTTTITQTESDGTNNDCTSIGIVRFAETLGTCFATNSGFKFTDFKDAEVNPNGIARLQIFIQSVIEKSNSFRRLSRIRL